LYPALEFNDSRILKCVYGAARRDAVWRDRVRYARARARARVCVCVCVCVCEKILFIILY